MRYLIRRFCGRTFAVSNLPCIVVKLISETAAVFLACCECERAGCVWAKSSCATDGSETKKSRRVWPYPYTAKLARYKLNSGAARLKWKVEISLLMWCMYHQHNLTFSDGYKLNNLVEKIRNEYLLDDFVDERSLFRREIYH